MKRVGMVVAGLLAAASLAVAGKVETWRSDTAAAFAKGKKERVVVSDTGRVRLGHSLGPVGSMTASRVWDLAIDAKGGVYAATGDEGKVFKLDGDRWEVTFDANDTQALSVVALPDGHAFAGTGPSGQVVDLTDPKHPAARPDPGVQYIWDLAADASGNLYAATGPTGQLWKRDAKGAWSLLLDSPQKHLLCVAVGNDGSIYAGSDGEGLLYRVAGDGRVSVVYDAPQAEIRSLLVAPDGTLYAGTAAESGTGGQGRPPSLFSSPGLTASPPSGPGSLATAAGPRADLQRPADGRPERTNPAGGTASPRPASPGENAVYRVGTDGVAREVFRGRVLIHALAWQGDRLLVGTGPDGQLFEVRDGGRESAPIARLDSGQILALANQKDGGLLVGTGDPGSVVRLGAGHAPAGSLTSDVHDAKLVSRFGAIEWKADVQRGTSLAIQTRTGNVGEPDGTWSPWSPEQQDPASARAAVPPGRFVQHRAVLRTDDPSLTPELRSVTIRYQTENLAPEINRLDVPDVANGDGATKPAKLSLRWDASDPNGDDLEYTLHVKKEGWPGWIKLGELPITEARFEWDATAVPTGSY
ncbi:MAG TPA: WD40 repeat domain-containing protein, partial [Isosphaeraceae bacterium]